MDIYYEQKLYQKCLKVQEKFLFFFIQRMKSLINKSACRAFFPLCYYTLLSVFDKCIVSAIKSTLPILLVFFLGHKLQRSNFQVCSFSLLKEYYQNTYLHRKSLPGSMFWFVMPVNSECLIYKLKINPCEKEKKYCPPGKLTGKKLEINSFPDLYNII